MAIPSALFRHHLCFSLTAFTATINVGENTNIGEVMWFRFRFVLHP